MPECTYCGDSFGDEAAYHEHLRAAHAEELGPIDRRVVFGDAADGSGWSRRALLVGGLVVVGAVLVGAFVTAGGDGSDDGGAASAGTTTPTDLWGVHYHGTIEVRIDGQVVDFSRPAYQLQADAFHFENRDGTRWHVHARGVTLAWAMDTLGIEVGPSHVAHRGTRYDADDPGVRVVVEVDGRAVTPAEYVLEAGDHIRIEAAASG